MKPTNSQYHDPTRKDWIMGIALLLMYLIVIGLGALILIPEYWYWWLLLFCISTILLVINQNRNYACRCRKCGHEFELGFRVNLISPHGVDKDGSWQWAKCPNCMKRAKTSVIKVSKAE